MNLISSLLFPSQELEKKQMEVVRIFILVPFIFFSLNLFGQNDIEGRYMLENDPSTTLSIYVGVVQYQDSVKSLKGNYILRKKRLAIEYNKKGSGNTSRYILEVVRQYSKSTTIYIKALDSACVNAIPHSFLKLSNEQQSAVVYTDSKGDEHISLYDTKFTNLQIFNWSMNTINIDLTQYLNKAISIKACLSQEGKFSLIEENQEYRILKSRNGQLILKTETGEKIRWKKVE